MKSLFLFRDCYDAKYILQELDKRNLLQAVILERGLRAKKRKLRRMFKISNFLSYPSLLLDALALLIYSKMMSWQMLKHLGKLAYPKNKIKLTVNDANEKRCIDFIKQYQPEVIFIYGTSILNDRFLKEVGAKVLNIHSGILPQYRNVHSDFWAYLKRDYQHMGVSIIHVDQGIDTGDVALQEKITYVKGDLLIDLKIKILCLIPDLIEKALKNNQNHNLVRQKQNDKESKFYPTPDFVSLIKYFFT